MQTGSNYTAQDISGLRMQDNLKTNITIYSSFMISVSLKFIARCQFPLSYCQQIKLFRPKLNYILYR